MLAVRECPASPRHRNTMILKAAAAPGSGGDAARGDAAHRGPGGPIATARRAHAALTVSNGGIVNAEGVELAGPFDPGAELYLRPRPGSGTITVTAFVPVTANGPGGQVITGVARDESNRRLTPVALVLPGHVVVDFDIHWDEPAPGLAQRAG